jgi:hypothetical protein
MCRNGNMELREMIYTFGKIAAPVMALALLAGCAVPPPAPYVPAAYASPVNGWNGVYRPAVTDRIVVPPVVQQQQTPDPAFQPEPVPAPYEQPVDPSCGWWRLCNLWSGS